MSELENSMQKPSLPGRLIGIDVGAKRVGLSRTDPMRIIPSPIGTFDPKESLKQIEEHVRTQGPVTGFVIGWPLNARGEASDSMKMVQDFASALERRFPNVPVHKVDEFKSSVEAMENLVQAGVPKGKRRDKARIDAAAASVLLQRYLASQER